MRARYLFVVAILLAVTAAASQAPNSAPTRGFTPVLVPAPASLQVRSGVTFMLTPSTQIHSDDAGVGDFLAQLLRRSTGYPLEEGEHGISLLLSGAPADAGDEGYRLDVSDTEIVVRANKPAGLFNGVQTLRQLLPPDVESKEVRDASWTVPGVTITDRPRFEHRGAMLDVVRHFQPVNVVKDFIDRMALYKLNYFHWHLTNDQGWRVEIESWPKLATVGGSKQVGGDRGGYYTKAQYREIVAYAAARNITVVPEIDMPGHTNAALASYPELNCNGQAKQLYTGVDVGFSSLCAGSETTYAFVDDVVREIAEMTPGPYFHIGGDEANATSPADYQAFMDRALPILAKYGKTPIGWHEFIRTTEDPSAIPQYWSADRGDDSVLGHEVILSPPNHAYLDMKYNRGTELGLNWGGYVDVRDSYDWNPGTFLVNVGEVSIRGVEAPLWTETVVTPDDIEYMMFPRLPAIAELGWSPFATHSWDSFRVRLGSHGPRWEIMGINFYRSKQIPWSGRHQAGS
ncbi:beta-N-acetylhexosaminidase [Lentzea sp. NBRC 105346]|uniref:beta-N-acetylhexosaminidase n=1 Tax=Lentzea sp. NBRC 105346 TaxID=3032205 RepID=UPI0024A2C99A|nr:beta-N-acetylhexosaminidase [Lentzea sp. NBRC 105346]GLZ31070.1 beta-N-acetylhexosaminidase [Lentzea sp. NBRC 105346]